MKFNGKKLLLMLIDFSIILFSSGITQYVLSKGANFDITVLYEPLFWMINSLFAIVVISSMRLFKVYNYIWRYIDTRELVVCAFSISCAWFAVGFSVWFIDLPSYNYPETHILVNYIVSLTLICLSRILYKSIFATFLGGSIPVEKNIRTMVVGAGYAGNVIVSEMLRPESEYLPVVMVDDDLDKKGRYIHGVKVGGTIDDIPLLAKEHNVSKIIIAIPSSNSKNRKRILEACKETKCEVNMLPYMHEMIVGKNLLDQTKEINLEDLLGRDPIRFEQEDIKNHIKGKVCLVTGGGGSIGSELSRQIAMNSPKKLVIVDIYENNAYEIQQELIRKYGSELDLDVRIASVRDHSKMKKLFEEFNPDLVFHAAAHKHVPLMEDSPCEAIKNNIFGTYNVARLADEFNVESFVLVSTDKAVNPTNVMGATKRCCEMIVEYMKQMKKSDTEYVAVRFGNVLGSNGSVVPLFEEQIKNGGPVTVTHPEIIRYFMTIPEATSLILQATSFAQGGEIFVLDMGEPVKILSLAENVIRMNGKRPYEDIKIEFTGLRPGEKLYEELLMSEEGLKKTENNKIFIGQQTEIEISKFESQLEELYSLAMENDDASCVDKLAEIVTTFKRNNARELAVSK